MGKETRKTMRLVHRYLGFFLAGIMAVYALSGIILIFRDTDFLKQEIKTEKLIESNLPASELSVALKIKGLKITGEEGEIILFDKGSYNRVTGEAAYVTKKLPYLLDKMTHMHKANSSHPLFWLNIFFGASLLFFVLSTFWMFAPSTSIYRKGLYFTAGGILITMLILFY